MIHGLQGVSAATRGMLFKRYRELFEWEHEDSMVRFLFIAPGPRREFPGRVIWRNIDSEVKRGYDVRVLYPNGEIETPRTLPLGD